MTKKILLKPQKKPEHLLCTEAKFASRTLSKFGCGIIDGEGNNIALSEIDEELELTLIDDGNDNVEAVITKDEDDLYFPFKVELTADSTDDIVEYLETMLVRIKSCGINFIQFR